MHRLQWLADFRLHNIIRIGLSVAAFELLLASFLCEAHTVSVMARGAWPGFAGSSAIGVCVSGNLAYTVGSSLQIFDIQSPSHPVRLSGLTLPNNSDDIVVSKGLAYVIGFGALRIINVSNPTNPISLGVAYVQDPYGVEVAGNYCYVSGFAWNGFHNEHRLFIYDVSNPTNIVLATDVHQSGRVRVAGNRGYFAGLFTGTGQSGITILDGMSSPFAPVLAGQHVLLGYPNDICLANTNAYLATGYGLEIFDVSTSQPIPLGTIPIADAERVQLVCSTAYLTRRSDNSLFVVDVGNPASPILLGATDLLTYPQGIAVQSNHAYIAGDEAGLRIFDVSDPSNVQVDSTAHTTIYGLQVDVANNYAYLADERAGFEVIDISNPDSLQAVGHLNTFLSAHAVRVQGTRAYVASEYFIDTLDAVDVSNPAAPVITASYMPLARVAALDVSGSRAYLATGESGLEIVDTSAATNLVPLGSYNTSGYASGVRVVGNLAYISDGSDGLQIVDVSTPSAPVRLGGYNTGGLAAGVDVSGSHAFIADGAGGLVILDVSNPAAPSYVGMLPAISQVYSVKVANGLAYLSDAGGLRIVDVHNPANPVEVGLYIMPDENAYYYGGNVAGDLIYAASGSAGLSVLQVVSPLVLNPPISTGGMIGLSWNGGPGIKLQRTVSLVNPAWAVVPGSDGVSAISVPITGEAGFFRLVK